MYSVTNLVCSVMLANAHFSHLQKFATTLLVTLCSRLINLVCHFVMFLVTLQMIMHVLTALYI